LPPWWSALSPIVRHAVENEWLADNVRWKNYSLAFWDKSIKCLDPK
jgi:hypothetical protein